MDIVTSESTQSVWSLILKLLASQHHIGFGVLDAFLSGDELDQRIALIEQEAAGNEWLRNELSDTLCLDQSDTLSCGQIERLRRAASV